MTSYQIVFGTSLVVLGIVVALFVVALSRHKKSATGPLDLRGSTASVENTLEPEGAVIVRGELWRARLRSGGILERGSKVRIVGARDHLLEVEPTL